MVAELLLILTATGPEQALLRGVVATPETRTIGHRKLIQGRMHGYPVAFLESGIGVANVAQALGVALESLEAHCVIQMGIGGAYPHSGLVPGDLALATQENYGDLGVITPEGWRPADEIGIPVVETHRPFYNTFPLDPGCVSRCVSILESTNWEKGTPKIRSGPFVTVQQCTGRTEVGEILVDRFDAVCESMEGAAAAHICTLYERTFFELRAISNRVEDRDRDAWDIPLALGRSQEAVLHLLERRAFG